MLTHYYTINFLKIIISAINRFDIRHLLYKAGQDKCTVTLATIYSMEQRLYLHQQNIIQ